MSKLLSDIWNHTSRSGLEEDGGEKGKAFPTFFSYPSEHKVKVTSVLVDVISGKCQWLNGRVEQEKGPREKLSLREG